MHPASTLVHEVAHRDHYGRLLKAAGLKDAYDKTSGKEKDRLLSVAQSFAMNGLHREYVRDPDWWSRLEKKIPEVSKYATSDPFEVVAEYTTAVRLGSRDRDPDLDKFCKAFYAPAPRPIRGAAKLGEKWRTK
jgi:hypothetical protein